MSTLEQAGPAYGAHKRSAAIMVAVTMLAIAGGIALRSLTQAGNVLSPDSAIYLGVANNLLAGRGLTVPFGDAIDAPLTHHAPFYPMMLAVMGLVAEGTLPGARLLAALLFGANLALVGMMTTAVCRNHPWLAIMTVALLLTSAPMLLIHIHAWSEPLFLLLGFGGLFLLARYIQDGKSLWLALAALALGLATLTRYAGISLIVTGLVSLLVVGTQSLDRRLRMAAVFGIACLTPLAVWLIRNALMSGTATNRQIVFHPVGVDQTRQLFWTLTGWLLIPEGTPGVLKATVLCFLVAAGVWIVWWTWRTQKVQVASPQVNHKATVHPLVWLLCIFVGIYGLFLAVSISFLDANTPLDDRILSPLFVASLVLGVFLVDVGLRAARNSARATMLASVAIVCVVAASTVNAVTWSAKNRTGDMGLLKQAWRDSEIIRATKALDTHAVIYTNAAELVYLHTGRSALTVPRKLDLATQQSNAEFPAQLQIMAQAMRDEGAVLVYFTGLNRSTLPTATELLAELPLRSLFQASDGEIFGVSGNVAEVNRESAGSAAP